MKNAANAKDGTRRNSFTALRLILAILVVISHAGVSSGHYFTFSFGLIGYGSLAVFAFFAISGFLITPGLIRDGFSRYIIRRSARIFPGYWGVSILTLLLFATIWGKWAGHRISLINAIQYLLHNLFFIPASPESPTAGWNLLQGLPLAVPTPHVVNVSIWTLPLEFISYIVLGILTFAITKYLKNSYKAAFAVLLLALWLSSLFLATHITDFWDSHPSAFITYGGKWPYLLSFFIGAAISSKREWLAKKSSWLLIPPLIVISYFAARSTVSWALIGALCFALAVILFGSSRLVPLRFIRSDISYGIYLYHWPVEQTLVHYLPRRADRPLFIVLSLLVSGSLAYLSARFIEVPAIRWGKRVSESRNTVRE